jgi:hypothetical protein
MKKYILFFVLVLFVFYLAYKLFFFFDFKIEQKAVLVNNAEKRFTQEDFQKIKEGDFILRRGYGLFSDLIADRLNDSLIDVTHAGILTQKNKDWYVIHSLSSDVSEIDGMQIQSLSSFLKYSQPKKIIVTRVKDTTSNIGLQITRLAYQYLQQKIPFDHKGDYENANAFFCTELIWRILETDLNIITLPKDKSKRKKLMLTMNGLYDPSYFDLIINHY